ncbi:hypothetical protein L596_005610 [Steinernema carpocapsae]|uniref:Homeobox domain-containing protein n=1 Tax=Steinernema carpocapsae TaxID=34508 RepID=A0A4U8V153_STECR|nr:hypothetical protein L596_005610 [Steinernema carpocapsae]
MASSPETIVATPIQDSSTTPNSRRFSRDQISKLKEFHFNKKQASPEERKQIAEATGLSEKQVRKWLENKRRTERRRTEQASGNAVKTNQIRKKEVEPAQESSTSQSSKVSAIPGLPVIIPEILEASKEPAISLTKNLLEQLASQSASMETTQTNLFEHTPPLPLTEVRSKLAEELVLTNKQVTRWFQNRRHVKRKTDKEKSALAELSMSEEEQEPQTKKTKIA